MKKYILFEEYIALGQVLKELGLISTGGQAKIFLAENEGNIFKEILADGFFYHYRKGISYS